MSGAVVASLRRSAPEMCLPSRVARILMLSTGETLAEFLNSVQRCVGEVVGSGRGTNN